MKPRILLTGKNGQVGFELHRLLLALGQVVAPDRHALDLLDANSIRRTVRDVRPQLIVNAAAYTAVDAAETDQVNAHAINEEDRCSAGALFDGLRLCRLEESPV